MATSGTSTFSLDIMEVIEEAFDRCGVRMKTGYDLKTARRSLDILFREWENRGINLWTVEATSVVLTASTATVTLATDTVDIIEAIIRTGTGTSQQDTPLSRISVLEYSHIPSKNTTGRPVNYWLDRQSTSVTMYVWPVPDSGSYTLVYYKLRRIEDTGVNPAATDPDVPARFIPAMVADLARKIALKYEKAIPRLPALSADFAEQWELAESGDRDRASIRIIPGGYKHIG